MDQWQPNPRATPFVPRRGHLGNTISHVGLRESSLNPLMRRRLLTKLFQAVLVGVLLVTICINVMFIVDTSRRLQEENIHTGENGELANINNRGNNLRLQENNQKSLNIEVISSQTRVSISVDGTTIHEDTTEHSGRGLHIVVLNQASGAVMAQRVFDTYLIHEDEAMVLFLNMVSDGRILVFSIKDEGTYQMKQPARELLTRLGSKRAQIIGWRNMWAMVVQKGVKMFAESDSSSQEFNTWGAPVVLRAEVPLASVEESECSWPDTLENKRRRDFCSQIEGYGSLCSCADPAPLVFPSKELSDNQMYDVPVVVIASNRPHYLYRMLRSILSAQGVNPKMITVFIDGYFEEPLEVTKLFGLRGIQHTPIGVKTARISQHYKASLTATFNLFRDAKYAIILEEDLDISPDFFSYFSQTARLLDEDSSLYCISAWNDHGYEHSSKDPSMLYRVEWMPGLGWLLKRSLYKNELESKWPTPEKLWDWDMWLRGPEVRKGRECVIPDVSRTYHFGSGGIHVNSYYQALYYGKHSFNTQPIVRLKDVENLKKENYEELITDLIKRASLLDHSKSPCDKSFIPENSADLLVMYIQMEDPKDFSTWLQVAKCFKIWDLDARGYHKSMWRFHYKSSHLIVVGVPNSEYSIYKPYNITPISLNDKGKVR